MEVRQDEREGCRASPRCPCHFNLLHSVYHEKLFHAPKLKGLFTEPGTKDRGWDIRRQTGGVEKPYSMVSYQI